MNFKQILGKILPGQIDLSTASAGTHPASRDYVTTQLQGAVGAKPTTNNKAMPAQATVSNGDVACSTAITATPAGGSYVQVLVNGGRVNVGNGVKTTDCYFSGNNGTSARNLNAVAAGDKLFWNGGIAGYQLETTDLIDFDYVV